MRTLWIMCWLAWMSMPMPVQGQEGLDRIIAGDAAVEKVTVFNTFIFLEGPAWDGRDHLYFSETRLGDIYKVDEHGKCTIVRDKTQYKEGANGLMFDTDGNLAIVERFAGRIALAKPDGTPIRVLAESWNGKSIPNPNDLCLDGKGGVYFTHPAGRNAPENAAPKGVYYANAGGTVSYLGCENLGTPNGVHVSENGKVLYVTDTSSEEFWAFDIKADGSIGNGRVFCRLQLPPSPGRNGRPPISQADGMTVDAEGNVYIATRLGIQVFDKSGAALGIITVPEVPANCAFGSPDNRTLFITANTSLYKIRTRVPGCYTAPFKTIK